MSESGADLTASLAEDERAEQEAGFAAIAALLEASQSVCVCGHTTPDGDALGSVLACANILRRKWPQMQVVTLLADNAPVPRIYRFLPGSEYLVEPGAYTDTPDLFLAVDLSEASRLNHAQAVLERSGAAAVIDHHPCNKPFAQAQVVRPGAAAAGIVVAEFAQFLGVSIDYDTAQCLLCAIVTDTGRFQYQNTDAEAFVCASYLVACGACPSEISLNVYQSFRLASLHLKSIIMGRITTFENGRIAYSYATQNDLARTGADLDECDGLIDAVRSVEGSEIALFLKKVPGGKVRGNLRAKGSHDVSDVARAMGGGGHRAAAGFTFEGDVDEALSAVLPLLRALVRGVGSDAPNLDATLSMPVLGADKEDRRR